jgi:3-oxoacyl-[acyl-carrier-protein] synthase-3
VSKVRRTARKTAIRAAITGVFGYVPPDVLSNAEPARLVDTSDEWIIERTGTWAYDPR